MPERIFRHGLLRMEDLMTVREDTGGKIKNRLRESVTKYVIDVNGSEL